MYQDYCDPKVNTLLSETLSMARHGVNDALAWSREAGESEDEWFPWAEKVLAQDPSAFKCENLSQLSVIYERELPRIVACCEPDTVALALMRGASLCLVHAVEHLCGHVVEGATWRTQAVLEAAEKLALIARTIERDRKAHGK